MQSQSVLFCLFWVFVPCTQAGFSAVIGRGNHVVSFVPRSFAATLECRKETKRTEGSRRCMALQMIASGSISTAGPTKIALKKPSKTLAVCVEYKRGETLDAPAATELANLSMQMRKMKVCALWTSDLVALQEFVKEQGDAKGNFPGPCPVIYHGDALEDAIEAGANAIVMNPKFEMIDTMKEKIDSKGVELIWYVSTADDVSKVMEVDLNSPAFFVDAAEVKDDVFTAIPSGSVVVAAVHARQSDSGEIVRGKELKKSGCTSILVKGACVGDEKDVEYAAFVVSGLTSKSSSEFKFTGMTHVVGHHRYY
uniref:Indole-3-glycerol-phosphate synthase n=1 Tax=Attheya septentrionalis TaxID=420275 RepID=A0A7S2U6G8_9STRA|mmetsp:Transcript_10315/g.18790  ORF Transcript_10315/g.18790 Transcript_10315/m.18790 type:complete len:310 (+) Transcript_10315:86-1015(+)